MKRLVEGLLIITVSSLGIINFSSGIIAGIWLLFLGDWKLIVFGIVLGVVMPYAYSLALLPQFLFLIVVSKLSETSHKYLFLFSSFILALYTHFILSLWITFVFNIALQYHYHPVLLSLWAYSTILGPIGYMASKEDRDSFGTFLGALFCQLGFVVLAICTFALSNLYLGYSLLWLLLLVFAGINSYLGFTQLLISKHTQKKIKDVTFVDDSSYEITNDKQNDNSEIGDDAEIITEEHNESRDTEYCYQCGNKILKGSNFCKYCGAKLKD